MSSSASVAREFHGLNDQRLPNSGRAKLPTIFGNATNMGNDDSMKAVMEDLMVSYQRGVESLTPIFSVAALVFDADGNEETGKDRLRETLAQNGNLRKKDFDRMMSAIAASGNGASSGIGTLVRDFVREQRELAERLSACFSNIRVCMETGDIENVKTILIGIREIVDRQEQAKRRLETDLTERKRKRDELHSGIRSLLLKGRELRIRDFKNMLTKFERQHQSRIEENRQRRKDVSHILAGYREQRLQSQTTKGG